jgi:murein L,D-transpeptidase YafK
MRRSTCQHLKLPATLATAIVIATFARDAAAQNSALLIDRHDETAVERVINPLDTDFAREQLRFPRVEAARLRTRFGIKQLYRERGIAYPAAEIFMRVFKRERVLEVWARPAGSEKFALLTQYRVCALAGEVGPKRRQGDLMTPEGFYEIDSFNPYSQYRLSLHVNYPNPSDRTLGYQEALGGQIFIHGGCKTAGCIAVTDESIEELYWIAVEARAMGQKRIPVHIFPARLDDEEIARLGRTFGKQSEMLTFWKNLRPGYEFFERNGRLPVITVDAGGRYRFSDPATGRSAEAPGATAR